MKETIILADNEIVNAQQSISSMNSLNTDAVAPQIV